MEIRAENQLIYLIGLAISGEDQKIRACMYAPTNPPSDCADKNTGATLEIAAEVNGIDISYSPQYDLLLHGYYHLLISASVFDSKPGDKPDRLPSGSAFLKADLGRP